MNNLSVISWWEWTSFLWRRWWYLCCPRLPRWIRFLSR